MFLFICTNFNGMADLLKYVKYKQEMAFYKQE